MLFLASRSPRRRELLDLIGVHHSVIDVEVPEVPAAGESALDYVRRVARDKAGAGWLQVAAVRDAVVLSADTEVVLGDDIFGKPTDADDARAMLRRLSGRTHLVHSAVCCVSAGREAEVVSTSEVSFAELSDAAIDRYVASGEAMGRAGAYAIQGRAGTFVSRLVGSYSGVMGLPLHETSRLLEEFGVAME